MTIIPIVGGVVGGSISLILLVICQMRSRKKRSVGVEYSVEEPNLELAKSRTQPVPGRLVTGKPVRAPVSEEMVVEDATPRSQ